MIRDLGPNPKSALIRGRLTLSAFFGSIMRLNRITVKVAKNKMSHDAKHKLIQLLEAEAGPQTPDWMCTYQITLGSFPEQNVLQVPDQKKKKFFRLKTAFCC